MGNSISLKQAEQMYPSSHIRIYLNMMQIRDPVKKAETIDLLLQSPEYAASARKAGVYSDLLIFMQKVRRGEETSTTVVQKEVRSRSSYEQLAKPRAKEKAISYFQSCLEVLGLEEEVALTEEALKIAYKKSALRAHPDKGGDETKFEAVTRAYAYLTEILHRIHGGRTAASKVEAPTIIKDSRHKESAAWQQVEPVRLNPKKLDVDAFNKMFEQTRMPDPDDDGYGDWLQGQDAAQQKQDKFSGKFNRDVFNKAFEDANRQQGETRQLITSPQALMLAPTAGVELGRGRPESFTAAANASLKYTDLKQAYTMENTISPQIANVRVDVRDIKQYTASRERAPDPLSHEEQEHLAMAERTANDREKQRQVRAAQEHMLATDYFERMKRLVITNQ